MMATLSENLAFVAAIAALGAWWISWREARRNNMVIVKLKRFTSAFTEDQSGSYHKLEAWVANKGIQLQSITMSLCFHGPERSGHISLPIPLSHYSKGVSSAFLRGTTASFLLSTSDKKTSDILSMLRSIREQRPVINLYNASFLAHSFTIYSRWDRPKKMWNRLSLKFRFTRRVGEGYHGKGVFSSYQLPSFEIRSEQLQFFLTGAKPLDPPHNAQRPVEPPQGVNDRSQ